MLYSFSIRATPNQFYDWLHGWNQATDPYSYHAVHRQNDSKGGERIFWHAHNELKKEAHISQIVFRIIPKEAELLDVTFTFADDPDITEYARPLLEAIAQRWPETKDIPNFMILVHDADLANILAARWQESYLTYRSGAYLSTVILLGSILEGALLAKIQQNASQATQSSLAPKERNGSVRRIEHWKLSELIAVCHERGWLEKDTKDFSSTLREYRNLVHPVAQSRQKAHPDAGTCRICREVVSAAFEELAR